MNHRFHAATAAALLLASTNCASLGAEYNRAVLIAYDHVNTFQEYTFVQPTHIIDWGGAANESGVRGWAAESQTRGFWATFLICSLGNTGSQAETFNYQASRFYVVYDGKQHFYRPLAPLTYSSLPRSIPGTASVTPIVNQYFREETQIGPDQHSFPVGDYVSVNYRIAIYITRSSPGPIHLPEEFDLQYDGYPNVMSPARQPPTVKTPTNKADLATTCRPPAQ